MYNQQTRNSSGNRAFLKLAAICSCLSALSTFLLWLLPSYYKPVEDFASGILVTKNFYYNSRLWVNLAHAVVSLTAYIGLTFVLMQRETFKAIFGMHWLILWGWLELCGTATIIFTVNRSWRMAYADANIARQGELQANIEAFFSIWDSLFFVLLVCFALGSLFMGWAAWSNRRFDRLVSVLLLMAVPLTMLIILSGYTSYFRADELIDIIYPVLQPTSRIIVGIYIWNHISYRFAT